jgi:DNA end-binding protein Ku
MFGDVGRVPYAACYSICDSLLWPRVDSRESLRCDRAPRGDSLPLASQRLWNARQATVLLPQHDEVVSRTDLVKGYEFAKNRYVTFTPEELQALDAESTQIIEITEFVPIEKIDPIYFEHPYHLGPGKSGQRAFAMLGKAMAQMDRAALGKYAARGKEHLVMVRPFAEGLVIQQLLYADEIRPAVAMNGGKVKESELKLAKQLIDQISSNEFKPEGYKDEVRERVRKQIQRKVKGEDITTTADRGGGEGESGRSHGSAEGEPL